MRFSSVATLGAARASAISKSKDNGGSASASPRRVAMTRPKWTSISPIRYPMMPGIKADVSGLEIRDDSNWSVGLTINRACLLAGHQALQGARNRFALLQRHLELTTRHCIVCSQYRRRGAGNHR